MKGKHYLSFKSAKETGTKVWKLLLIEDYEMWSMSAIKATCPRELKGSGGAVFSFFCV